MRVSFQSALQAAERFSGTEPRRIGAEFRTFCPFHETPGDSSPSLDIREGKDGIALIQCRSKNCSQEDILTAFGFEKKSGRPIRARYTYRDAQGRDLAVKLRFDDDQTPKCLWDRKLGGQSMPLYRVDSIAKALESEDHEIFVCEGEKDVETLISLGFPAVCSPHGAAEKESGKKWSKAYTQALAELCIVVFQDNDDPGKAFARHVAGILAATGQPVQLVPPFEGPQGYDVSDWVRDGGTREKLEAILKDVPPFTPEKGQEQPVSTVTNAHENVWAEPNVDDFVTDNTVSKRFISLHANQLRFVEVWKRWLIWLDGRWQFDETRSVDVLARSLVKKLLIEAVDSNRTDRLKVGVEFQKRARIEAVVALSRCDPRVSRRSSDFDRDQWLFNCANGTLDLRTGVIHEHRQEDHITKSSPVPFVPHAQCPRWEKFLEEVFPDDSVRAYVKRAVGYSLTGSVREQVLFFAHGGGANGKSVLLNTVSYILGNYGKTAAPELLVVKTNEKHETELADLAGVRLVTTIETESGRRLAESKTKMLTGGDRIKARFLYADFFEFAPTFKLWLASNHKPSIRGTDYAIWRRIHLIPFTVVFSDDQQDKSLPEKLISEASGILKWAVDGCLEWLRDGLRPPGPVLEAVRGYRAEMDTIGQFLAERCLEGKSLYVSSKDLYASYETWCRENGEHAVTQRALGLSLQERGFTSTRERHARSWFGLTLRPDTGPEKGVNHGATDANQPEFCPPCSRCGEPCEPGKFACPSCFAAENEGVQ